MKKLLVLLLLFLSIQEKFKAQCIVINEVMINAAGGCDGGCNPNTSEWTELYNTCSTPIDISCYVLTDGDFTITFPVGTIVPANGFLTIGSNGSGGPVDINLATCSCTSGAGIGTFTNANEQLLLVNSSGVIQNAIYWGSGQFPLSISTSNIGTCSSLSFNEPNNANFTQVPSSSGCDGCTIGRTFDGASCWELNQVPTISLGTTNGSSPITVDFIANDTTICPGNSINFTDNSSGSINSWLWTFNGAVPATASMQSASNITYNTIGNYDVTLQVTTTCGVFSLTKPNYIQVGSGTAPNIIANGVISFCTGGNVILSTSNTGNFLWNLNGTPIAGATNDSLIVTQTGSYSILDTSNICNSPSMPIVVTVNPTPNTSINALSTTTICNGDSVIMASTGSSGTYQWLLNGIVIPSATNQQYTAFNTGNYSLVLSNGNGCLDTSTAISVNTGAAIQPTISSSNSSLNICQGESITLSATAGLNNYQWLLNNNLITLATNDTIIVSQTGIYSVQNVNNSCTATSSPITITVNPIPNASINALSITTFCNGDSVIMASTGSSGTYQWLLNGAPLPNATNQQYTAFNSGNYSLVLSNGNGCVDTSNSISVNTGTAIQPTISSSNNSLNICQGDNLILIATASLNNYQWLLNNNLIAGANNDSLIVSQTGIYSVQNVNNACTATSTPITITVNPIPNASINALSSTTICNGDSVIIASTGSVGNYQWLVNGATLPGATNQQYTANVSGAFALVLTNSVGCSDTSTTINVSVSSNIIPNITSSTGSFTICQNQSLLLKATTGLSNYQWMLNNNPISNANNDSLSVTQSGIYSVLTLNTNGCSAASSPQNIIVFALPIANISPSSHLNICTGTSVTFQVSQSQTTYQWYNGTSPIAGATSSNFTTNSSGVYSVIITNLNGCSNHSDTVGISFVTGETANIVTSKALACVGDTVNLTISNSLNQILWSTNETGNQISITEGGNYTVTAKNAVGCTSSNTIQYSFTSLPIVEAGTDLKSDCINGVQLNGVGSGTPNWQPNEGLDNTSTLQPMANPDSTTTYILTIDNGVCKSSDSITVIVDCFTLYVPNTFTPNRDGNNEEFKPIGLDIDNYLLKIFNRWGVLIFESSNGNIGWNGTFKGQDVQDGTYFWIIEPKPNTITRNIPTSKSSGFVQLLR